MFSRKTAQKSQDLKWEDIPYGDYLNAVDDLLESKIGRTSTQEELRFIADCQEECCLPPECVNSIISHDWK